MATSAATFIEQTVEAKLILTSVFDTTRGGRGVEVYVTEDVIDLSHYAVSRGTNGRVIKGLPGADEDELEPVFIFPTITASAGTFLTLGNESRDFPLYFGFEADYYNTKLSFDGDDTAAILRRDTSSSTGWSILDILGTQDIPETPPAIDTAWNYQDSWIYRKNGTTAKNVFDLNDWFYPTSGNPQSDHLDGIPKALAGGTGGFNGWGGTEPVPLGSYQVPEPSSIALIAVAGAMTLARRRKV
ncbi:MAG: PEP-CTERM sorting domain-containing protein [Phycisphaerales bacterium]|nr:PEP-CTERM sorting domain-containing protein [Phycisphaerales bacterium]